MLLSKAEEIHANIVESLGEEYNLQIFYGSGSLKEMNEFVIVQEEKLPLLWFVKEEGINISSNVSIPFSNVKYATNTFNYVLVLEDSDIDNPMRNEDMILLDNISERFMISFGEYEIQGGIVYNSGSKSPVYRNTVQAVVGMAFTITSTSPNIIDYCKNC